MDKETEVSKPKIIDKDINETNVGEIPIKEPLIINKPPILSSELNKSFQDNMGSNYFRYSCLPQKTKSKIKFIQVKRKILMII